MQPQDFRQRQRDMKLQLSGKNLFAFFLFALLMGEAHEIAHFITGKIMCGCWPAERDFNAWRLCDTCEASPLSFWAAAAGPVFSMSLAWTGMWLLKNSSTKMQSLGFALIWGNVPQARIMTVLMGGGDEMVVVRSILQGTNLLPFKFWIACVIVIAMALPPIITSFLTVKNKYGWLYNIGFMILPLVVIGAYGFVFLNGLLKKGFLADVWIMGTPLFITVHTLLVLLLFLVFMRKEVFTYARDNSRVLYS